MLLFMVANDAKVGVDVAADDAAKVLDKRRVADLKFEFGMEF